MLLPLTGRVRRQVRDFGNRRPPGGGSAIPTGTPTEWRKRQNNTFGGVSAPENVSCPHQPPEGCAGFSYKLGDGLLHSVSNALDYCFCGLCASFAHFAVQNEDFTAKNAKP